MIVSLLAVGMLLGAAPAQRAAEEFLVSRPGASWTYHWSNNSDETLTITSVAHDGTIEVAGAGPEDDDRTWRLESGAWVEGAHREHGGATVVLLPAVLQVGTRWHWHYISVAREAFDLTFEVVSLSSEVKLPKATYRDCLVVKVTGASPAGYRLHFFAPGRGEVGVQMVIPGGEPDKLWERTLTRFSPGGGLYRRGR